MKPKKSFKPSALKSVRPTTFSPSIKPTAAPSAAPTSIYPTMATKKPSLKPTRIPVSKRPSAVPTRKPTTSPTRTPSVSLKSKKPTFKPTRIPTVKQTSVAPSLPRRTILPTSPPTFSSRPLLYVMIGQTNGVGLNIAEIMFYYKGKRLPADLFHSTGTSWFGSVFGPVTDPIGDTFGAIKYATDGDLRTSCRNFDVNYTYHYPYDTFPRMFFTTDKGNHFDQIVIYNRRYPPAWKRNAGALIKVLLYTMESNVTLWTGRLEGAKYVYNFTNVYTGPTEAPTRSPTKGLPSPSFVPTPDPTIYYYYTPPVQGTLPTYLVVTIDQPNGKTPLMVAEVVFKRKKVSLFALLTFDSTSKKNRGFLNGDKKLAYGCEFLATDGNLNTFFFSEDSSTAEDADPTLILYASTTQTSFRSFDEVVIYNVNYRPMWNNLAGARLKVFYIISSTGREQLVYNATLVGTRYTYNFTGISIPPPAAMY